MEERVEKGHGCVYPVQGIDGGDEPRVAWAICDTVELDGTDDDADTEVKRT